MNYDAHTGVVGGNLFELEPEGEVERGTLIALNLDEFVVSTCLST